MRYLILELCSRFFFSSSFSSFVHVVSLSVMDTADGSWVLQKNTTVFVVANSKLNNYCGSLLVTPRGTLQAFF